ncbi:hypothetical protein L1987_28141 [Smallanthus sonchifolius]|uniref:Uncharacterized protein n=1 Tax=Smallanthus sonchifolius TaxID=185202 RepID=A0ACB9IDZ6_9ASTR|nr:hypothetical protein L1987_28141 [Smallanthus sonchifolius]
MDLFSPVSVMSLERKSYCRVVTYDFSRFTWVFFLAKKDETPEILKTYLLQIEILFSLSVKTIRSDHGTEFKNATLDSFCESKGISRQFSAPRTPQQNGVAERRNRTLIEAARTMIVDSKLPVTFWAEAVNTACFVQNRVLITKSCNKTPYEIMYKRKPVIDFFRKFGCVCTMLNTSDQLNKFEAKADECYFVGYSSNQRAFRVYHKKKRIVMESIDINWHENNHTDAGDGPNWLFDVDSVFKSFNLPDFSIESTHANPYFSVNNLGNINDQGSSSSAQVEIPVVANAESNMESFGSGATSETVEDNSIPIVDVASQSPAEDPINDIADPPVENLTNLEEVVEEDEIPQLRIHKIHPTNNIIGPLHVGVSTRSACEAFENSMFSCFISQTEPKNIKAALLENSWVEAMQEELQQFSKLHVWNLVDLPKNKVPIGTRWVFRNKKDEGGTVIRNKARLVVQGFYQEEGIDYEEVFVPVARLEAIRMFLAYAAYMDFAVHQMDVKSAFLYGKFQEEVYVKQPPGFIDPNFPDRVYKLDKALYGLHQAPRAWYETLSKHLLENGFTRGAIDQTLFKRKEEKDTIMVQIYVDDIIFGSTNPRLCKEFEEVMRSKFEMSSMGEMKFFLGLQVDQSESGILIHQEKYVKEILTKFKMADSHPVKTPVEVRHCLTPDVDGESVDPHLYRSMIGSLMYLTASRPDIMFAVCLCARFQANPKLSHLSAVKCILRYLRYKPKLGLWYPKTDLFDLVAYSDSDYGGCNLDRKSTSGGCQFLGNRLVSWQYNSLAFGMDLVFMKRHNVCAFLNSNDPKAAEFIPVLNFLANSNISFAISHNMPVFEATIRQFWETAEIITVDNVQHIRATVHGQEVLFSEETVREVLQLNDNPEAPFDFPIFYVKECFRRMGHPDEFKSGQIIKNSLPSHWRYIVHVFIHCLSIRKGGFDSANSTLGSAILGLIKGRDYNFSGFIFTQLKDNLTGAVKEKFLAYPRFLQIIINHLLPELQQGGNTFVFDNMIAKTLSYMKSTNKRTNRAIADIPLFGHIIGEEEEFIPDIDPDLEEENLSSDEEELETEQNQGNPPIDEAEIEVDIPIVQEEEQHVIEPVIEAPFVEEIQIVQEPAINVEAGLQEDEEEVAESSGTLDAGIYGSNYYKSDSDERIEQLASSSKRQIESGSDFEEEEPRAKKIKTGLEDLSSSSESSFTTPEPSPHPTPQQSPIHTPPTSPQQLPIPTPPTSPQQLPIPTPPTSPQQLPIPTPPTSPQQLPIPTPPTSPQQSPIHTPPASPHHDSTSPVPRLKEVKEEVKDLKLEVGGLHTQIDIQQTQLKTQQRLIIKQHEDFKALAEIVKQLKDSVNKPTPQQPTTSKAQGETTSELKPSSPAFVTDPESALTVYTGHGAMTKESVEVKVEETESVLTSAHERREARKRGKGAMSYIETVILDEEDIPSDDELNALLDEIDNFGYNDLHPEILTTEEKETERTRYFTEEGDEIQTLSDEEDVQINLIKTIIPEPTIPISESNPTQDQPSTAPEPPISRKSWFKKIIPEKNPQTYEWRAEHQELKRPPIGWKYDAERKLFIIRRYRGGVQHFKNMTDFQTLPFYDLRDLAKLPLQNPGKVMMAYDFERFLHSQVNNDFKGMKPRKTQKKISKTRFHPKTKKPYVFLRYKPAQTHKTVQLQTFRKWFYNPVIGSAVIECEGKEDITIFDPMELLKFQPEDLEVLFQNHIQAYSDEDEADAKAYQRIVSFHVKPFIPTTSEGPAA